MRTSRTRPRPKVRRRSVAVWEGEDPGGRPEPPRDHPSWQALLDDVRGRQAQFSDEDLTVVARWVAVMGDELHRRAGELAVARTGREALARRKSVGR